MRSTDMGSDIDGERLCLMHIPTGKGDKEFQQEIERILSSAAMGLPISLVSFFLRQLQAQAFNAECVFVGAHIS